MAAAGGKLAAGLHLGDTGMHVELVRTFTPDGLRLDGALYGNNSKFPAGDPQPGTWNLEPGTLHSPPPEPSAALLLHGVAGNFYTSNIFEKLTPRLQDAGLAVLAVNTRGHDSVFGAVLGTVRRRLGAAYETVDDCRLDIAAWIEFLTTRGHQSIVLIGHSLGAVKAIYAQAHERWREVVAIVAASPPRLSYSAFMNSPENSLFFDSLSTAQQMAKEGRGEELFTSKFPFPLLITASGFIDKYGPAERYNILRCAHELTCPALFTYGSRELTDGGIPFAGMPEAVLSLPNADHRQAITIDGGDHFYSGVTDQLVRAITDWLSSRFSRTA